MVAMSHHASRYENITENLNYNFFVKQVNLDKSAHSNSTDPKVSHPKPGKNSNVIGKFTNSGEWGGLIRGLDGIGSSNL